MSNQVAKLEAHPVQRFIDLSGHRFGRLVAVSHAGKIGQRSAWLCVCDCGNETVVRLNSLRQGATKSCGCMQRELASQLAPARNKVNAKHGQYGSPEYRSWHMMLQRCRNTKNKDFVHYGARGIEVCERWTDFRNFLSDMGLKPSRQHTIERIDNDGPYAPENCKWATRKEQRNNQRPKP